MANEPQCMNVGQIGFFEEKLDDLTQKFARVYEEYLQLNVSKQKPGLMRPQNTGQNDVVGNRNHAMRFSF